MSELNSNLSIFKNKICNFASILAQSAITGTKTKTYRLYDNATREL